MLSHLRANLLLLVVTLFLCSIAYPAILLGFGEFLFPSQAEGSLIRDAKGTVVGSRLIAQPFTADENFQPRPSSASYNGAASGATNWGASNYLLRDRVARQLGPIVRYAKDAAKSGKKPENTPGLNFLNTGVELITDKPVNGLPSTSAKDGLGKCWG